MRINSNTDADLARHNANTKRIQALTRELRVLRLSNRAGQNHYQLKTKLDLERGKHSGGNPNALKNVRKRLQHEFNRTRKEMNIKQMRNRFNTPNKVRNELNSMALDYCSELKMK